MPACSTLKRHQVDRRVLSSSIDLNVELHAVAFVQGLKTRAFHGTDMHECVGLAVITRDEAEALHRIEELDRACCLFAGELALRSCCRRFPLLHGDHIADDLQIAGRNLASAINQLKLELLTFCKAFKAGALYRADVHKHILAALITLDEAEAFGRVEELYCAAALADNLGWHTAATRSTATETTAAATTRTTAETAPATIITATETVATAEAIATTAETVTATETILSGEERVELVLSKPIPLVAAPSATTFIKTHLYERTFAAPLKYSPDAWTNRVRRQKEEPSNSTILSCNRQSYTSRGRMANRITYDFRQTARIWSQALAILACLLVELRLFDAS
jgi:hypothetical protein